MGRVLTWNNHSEERESCVFIRGKFYHKERDCYLHNGIYYSPFSRYYVLDNETQQKVFNIDGKLKYGIIGVGSTGFSFGYFSPNIANNGEVMVSAKKSKEILHHIAISKNPQNYYLEILSKISKDFDIAKEAGITPGATNITCMNVWPLLLHGYLPVFSSDAVVDSSELEECKIDHKKISAEKPYNFNLAYNSETMMDEFQRAYEGKAKYYPTEVTEIANLIGNHTFGIEYESWDGRIPTYFAAKNGLIPLRDGSLRHDNVCGYEYASVIMQGERGIDAIWNQCKALKDFTTFNEKCSMHIHIGNIDKTAENLIHLWKGFESIQKDLFLMFPSCLMATSAYKQKDYCSMLPIISAKDQDPTADEIVSFLSGGKERFDKFGKKHPQDPGNQSKWNIASRYHFINFNNFYYTGRGTVELRISTPTFNHNKVTALLIIFNQIINEAISGKYHSTVESLLKTIGNTSIKLWLFNYVGHRKKELCKFTATEKGVIYHETITNDESTGNKQELY